MNEKDIIFYNGHKLQFWGGSWDLYDKNQKYIIKCFRYLEDAKAYIDKIDFTEILDVKGNEVKK